MKFQPPAEILFNRNGNRRSLHRAAPIRCIKSGRFSSNRVVKRAAQSLSLVSLLFCFVFGAVADEPQRSAPGYGALPFQPATPGSYALPAVGQAADGEVLDTANRSVRLHDLMGDKLVLLSFIYAACSDVNGCPLATQVLHKISRQLQKQPELADKLRLLTLSFNPAQDTPEMMRHYGEGFKTAGFDWQFLTTRDEQALQPILDGYQQNVQKIYDERGQFTGTFSHLLRVYLIDKQKNVRNIYNVDFLHADTVLNDVKTLLAGTEAQPALAQVDAGRLYQAGDNKQDYRAKDYRTHSLALAQRRGKPADLIEFARTPPLGLPALPVPKDNPLTPAKIALGRKLFYDRRLSLNNTFSCAICHIPEQGFANNEMATAVGVEGRSVRRNAPSLYNVGYAELLFHDGRENSLEQQAWGPLLAHNEMANPAIGRVVDKLKATADYRGLFEKAFNHKGPGMETIGQALASYQRTLNSADSAFDRWYFAKRADALGESAERGYQLFTGKAACSGCHTIGREAALFTDQKRHNTGVGYAEAMQTDTAKRRVQVAPGVFLDVDSENLKGLDSAKTNDLGYYEVSQNPLDRWSYKTPSLRNVALTAPYMHNGSFATLDDVVRFYNQGGTPNENLSPLIKPLGLSDAEQADLVQFLKALTGANVGALVSDGFAAPVGDAGGEP